MQQIELQKEFDELVHQITKDVLELSVIKSVEGASNEIKKQVPSLEKNSGGLRRSIEILQGVSQELSTHLQELKSKEKRSEHQLKSIVQKVEGNSKGLEKIEEEIGKEFSLQQQMIISLDSNIQKQLNDILDKQRLAIKDGVTGVNEIGNKTKTIALWNLSFSISAFGVAIAILLNALSII